MLTKDFFNEKLNNKLLDIFTTLVKIPSPSLKEDNLIKWIVDFAKENQINHKTDDFGNIIITLSATDSSKAPILLSAHMDVVGDDLPINLIKDGDFLKTDGTRTLGADDKVGVAICLMVALEHKNFSHGEIEIVLTRDEEHSMSGIKNLDCKSLNAQYTMVLDADKIGQFQISGASYTNVFLEIETKFGGHSGIDIGDKTRFNAVKLIGELINEIPQGVFFEDETGVITSINIGSVIGGGVENCIKDLVENKSINSDFAKYIALNSMTNVINTKAFANYSIRSASVSKELELQTLIKNIIEKFNAKYSGFAIAKLNISEHLPPFEKSNDTYLQNLYLKSCEKMGLTPDISSFHAGAETHIYCQFKNKNNAKFLPVLVGCADIFNMHSSEEKVNYKTMFKGLQLIIGILEG